MAQPSPPWMCAELVHQPTVGQNHPTASPFYIEVLDSSCILSDCSPKGTNSMARGCRMVVNGSVIDPRGRGAPWRCPAAQHRMVPHIASPEKDHNLKFEGWPLLNSY